MLKLKLKLIATLLATGIASTGVCSLAFAAPIDHLEPSSWWVGMQEPTLQLMLHGDNISQYQPQLDYAGVKILSTKKTDNPNYLFINLHVAANTKPGNVTLRFTQTGKTEFTHHYPLLARRNDSALRAGYSGKDVIYLITPDRFANGDSSNDSVAELTDKHDRSEAFGRHGGDLAGIIQHLDYLQKLGVTQLWLNPVMTNAQPQWSYHGYAITDFYNVDPRFGSNKQYQQLSQQARQRGIGLIIDLVLNHAGNQHWWMKDLPSRDWINHGGKFIATNHMRETMQDPHGVDSDRQVFNDGWFVETMPDLNQRNSMLANYLVQNAIWWIEYANLSGIRIDTWPYSDKQFLVQWSQRIMAEYPNFNMVGEEWSVNPNIIAYWQADKENGNGYQTHLPGLFDFPLQDALKSALTEPEDWGKGLVKLYQALAADGAYVNPDNLVVFADNHDMSRIHTQLGEDPALTRMAMIFFATTRGIPQFFYGTEILMNNPGTEEHGVIRSDFPGGWTADKTNAFTGKGLTPEQKSMQDFTRKLLQWRKTATAIHNGKLTHYTPEKGVYVYFRHNAKQRVMVVINKNDKPVALSTARFAHMLNGFTTATDVLTQSSQSLAKTLTANGKSATVFDIH